MLSNAYKTETYRDRNIYIDTPIGGFSYYITLRLLAGLR